MCLAEKTHLAEVAQSFLLCFPRHRGRKRTGVDFGSLALALSLPAACPFFLQTRTHQAHFWNPEVCLLSTHCLSVPPSHTSHTSLVCLWGIQVGRVPHLRPSYLQSTMEHVKLQTISVLINFPPLSLYITWSPFTVMLTFP